MKCPSLSNQKGGNPNYIKGFPPFREFYKSQLCQTQTSLKKDGIRNSNALKNISNPVFLFSPGLILVRM